LKIRASLLVLVPGMFALSGWSSCSVQNAGELQVSVSGVTETRSCEVPATPGPTCEVRVVYGRSDPRGLSRCHTRFARQS
jgi:hypothetical protein